MRFLKSCLLGVLQALGILALWSAAYHLGIVLGMALAWMLLLVTRVVRGAVKLLLLPRRRWQYWMDRHGL
jgi:hypothetical protein